MAEDIIRLAVVNFKPSWGEKDRNLKRIKGFAKSAAKKGVDMVIFPEMALTGYDNEKNVAKEKKMQVREAETIPGPSTREISQLSQEENIYIIFGMPEIDENFVDVVYNSAAICCPDGRIHRYRKIHLPLDESDWATSGSDPMLFDTEWGPVGLAICYDIYAFPELTRYCFAKGARLMINCTACAVGPCPPPSLRTELEALSINNCAVVASADLCGKDNYNYFIGGSSIMFVN